MHKNKQTSKAIIENPGMQMPVVCWAWTQKALFTVFFCLFLFRQSCTVNALSSKMHRVVSSLHRVQTIWSVRKPLGLASHRRDSGFVHLQVFEWSLYPCWEAIRFLTLGRTPPVSYSIWFGPQKAATGSAGKLEAAVRFPGPTVRHSVLLSSLRFHPIGGQNHSR